MITELYIYQDSKIIKGKNFAVDDISQYLSTLTYTQFSNFQMLKIERTMKIKLNISEDNALQNEAANYYVKIIAKKKNQQGLYQPIMTYYYYVNHLTFLSDNTIELDLEMDTINTYCYSLLTYNGYNLRLDKRTKVIREHKDRLNYVNKDSTYVMTDRYVDLYSEGINPKLYKLDMNEDPTDPLYEIEINNHDNLNWYLVYRSDESNAVECFCFTDIELSTEAGINRTTLYPTDFVSNTYYLINGFVNNHRLFNEGDSATSNNYIITITLMDDSTINIPLLYNGLGALNDSIYFNIESGAFKVARINSEGTYTQLHTAKAISFIDNRNVSYILNPATSVLIGYFDHQPTIYEGARMVNTLLNDSSEGIEIDFTNATSQTLNPLSAINRDDAKLIKIIKLPYRPDYFGVDKINNKITYPLRWTVSTYDTGIKALQLTNKHERIMSDVYDGEIPLAFRPYRELVNPHMLRANVSLSYNRDDYYESKLWHSDYYQPKFIYDSFSYIFQLEKLDIAKSKTTAEVNTWCDIDFIPSTTINSRFMFRFPNVYNKYETEDYPFILNVARNNEMPIYNSEYINYIRTGFNYDVKSKQRSEAKTLIGAAATTTTALTYAGIKVATASAAAGPVGAVIGAGVAIATAITYGIMSTVQSEENLNKKKDQLLEQSASVYGSDDVDLYSLYTNNRAKYAVYRCSPKVRQGLADLFYYTGYISNEIKLPNITSRKWFNFLQCDPVFSYVPRISEDIKADIIAKFNEGITFLHKNVISDVNTWDFEQTKENWEVALYNSVNN